MYSNTLVRFDLACDIILSSSLKRKTLRTVKVELACAYVVQVQWLLAYRFTQICISPVELCSL